MSAFAAFRNHSLWCEVLLVVGSRGVASVAWSAFGVWARAPRPKLVSRPQPQLDEAPRSGIGER
eukprot:13687922-Alexandrium_andersonii.AAC.1